MTQVALSPVLTNNSLTSITLPDTDECIGADTKPRGSPIFCPTLTKSFLETKDLQGAPIFWISGMYTLSGASKYSMGSFSVIDLLCLGCIPPLNVVSCKFFPPYLKIELYIQISVNLLYIKFNQRYIFD